MHGVDVEGLQLGVDEELLSVLAGACEQPVTYAGGVCSLVGPRGAFALVFCCSGVVALLYERLPYRLFGAKCTLHTISLIGVLGA